jgi:hypothetical protein
MRATARSGRSFLDRFGATILRGGIAPVPATLYFFQAELGLSPQEVWFIGYILAHKWDEDLPHPSLVKMAERVGVSRRQLQRIRGSLTAKGLLSCVSRHQAAGGKASNGYDFSGLFGRLERLIREHGPRGECPIDSLLHPEEDEPTMAHGDVTPMSHGYASRTSHRDASRTSQGTAAPKSQTYVSPASHRSVTPTSHDSEATHAEAKRAETKHVDLPPPSPSNGPSSQVRSEEEVERFNQATWRSAQAVLRVACRPDEYERMARYVQLLELDQERGWALLGVPNAHLREQVQTHLTVPIQVALERACGSQLRLLIIVRSAQTTPRLAELLATTPDTASAAPNSASS